MHWFKKVAIGTTVAAIGGLTVAGTAAAAAGTHTAAESTQATQSTATAVISRPTTSYSEANEHSLVVDTSLRPGTRVTVLCFTDQGQPIDGNTYWFRVVKTNNLPGYVHRSALADIPTDVQNCGRPTEAAAK